MMTYHCYTCGADNHIVNQCGCDPQNMPTRLAQHTPGEWEAVFGELDGQGEFSVYQGETGTICRGDNEMLGWKANAQLIAAAPDLYEACKVAQELVKIARQYFPKSMQNSDKFQLENICATIGKALFKAEGKELQT